MQEAPEEPETDTLALGRAHVRQHAHMQKRPTGWGVGTAENPLNRHCMRAPSLDPARRGRRLVLRRQVRESTRVKTRRVGGASSVVDEHARRGSEFSKEEHH